MTSTRACPAPEVFVALLNESLSDSAEQGITEHIEHCLRCQQALDVLAPPAPLPLERPTWGNALESAVRQLQAEVRDLELGTVAQPGEEETDVFAGWDEPARLGRYEVRRVIGRGGMGVVLEGFDPTLERLVAIKVLAPQLASSAAARQRFAREARAVAAISHEHVVAIHEVNEADGLPYLVMEHVAGLSLQEWLDRTGPLPLPEVLRIGMQVALGLSAAHQKGLIHRDVKPANILLQMGNGEWLMGNDQARREEAIALAPSPGARFPRSPFPSCCKITDFGLARAVDDASLTRSGVVAGTPLYMAPEQARGEPLGPSADLFSLGSVLYALCTGLPPFRAASSLAVLKRICEDEPWPVRELNPDVPDWLVRVIGLLHAKCPADRFGSAAEVAGCLAECLAYLEHPSLNLPLLLRPPTRRAWLRWGLLGGGALLGAGGLFSAWRLRRLEQPPAPSQPGNASIQTVRLQAALPHPGPVLSVAFAPGGEALATACHDKIVRIWGLATGRQRGVLTGHLARVWSVAFSPDGQTLASCAGAWVNRDEAGELKVWDVTTRRKVRDLPGHTALVLCVAFSPDGRLLASASWDKTVRLWEAPTGKPLMLLRGHTEPVRYVAYSRDGSLLASAGFDGTIRLWDGHTGAPRGVLASPGHRINCIAFSPDGLTLASAENPAGATKEGPPRPGRVRLWDVASGRVSGTLCGHKGKVQAVAFAPNGKDLASGGGDWERFGEVVLWDVQRRARRITLHGHAAWVESVVFAPMGRTLVSAGGAGARPGEVCFWELGLAPTGEPGQRS